MMALGLLSLRCERCSCLIVIEHEQPYGRREITLLAVSIDADNQIGLAVKKDTERAEAN
jgi:hypothetical protein